MQIYAQQQQITGDGITKSFPFPHGLTGVPIPVMSFNNNNSSLNLSGMTFELPAISADATNVIICYPDSYCPPSGALVTINVIAIIP